MEPWCSAGQRLHERTRRGKVIHSAIASSSLATEWLKGKTVEEAKKIKNTDIVNELKLPPVKIHCSVLAEDAIKAALADFQEKWVEKEAVVMRGANDDELADLIEFGKRSGAEVRFIEYMDVGGATRWSMDKVFSRGEILEVLGGRYGRVEPVIEVSSVPADRFILPDGTVFGIIASTTTPFCRTCDRSRLTADGTWYLCLYAQKGIDLRTPLRGGASRDEIKSVIRSGWTRRRDWGAEERKELEALGVRGVLLQIEGLRQDPRLEMHTRGG